MSFAVASWLDWRGAAGTASPDYHASMTWPFYGLKRGHMDILNRLAPKPFEVDLELAQGAGDNRAVIMAETVTICMPTYLEWEEIDASVENPVIPLTRIDGNKKLPNLNDPDYLEALKAAGRERQVRAVAFALVKGGNTIDGVTWARLRPDGGGIHLAALAQASDALQGAALGGYLLGIYRVMTATLNMDTRRKEEAARADRFHGAQTGRDADLLADGIDARSMAEPE